MKNLSLFPLERNNYFTGKLLTARDFAAEQKYINDKRRLINRFLGGIGIVCGMLVSKLDSAKIIIESGLALDGAGREITIPISLVRKLSDIDGFKQMSRTMASHVYLCVEYDEAPKEPIHGISDETFAEKKYNRIEDSFRLFLTGEEPRPYPAEKQGEQSTGEWILSSSLEAQIAARLSERIYLAKIELAHWGSAYEIETVVPAPSGQFVLGAQILDRMLKESCAVPGGGSAETPEAPRFSSGSVTFEVPLFPMPKQSPLALYSEDISHGLGSGEVTITLGLSEKNGAIFGNPRVFSEEDAYDFAAKADFSKGTFRVGLMCWERKTSSVTLLWTAAMAAQREGEAWSAPSINIIPEAFSLNFGGVMTLRAEVSGLENTDVVWSIAEDGAGQIDSYGKYTAPYRPGLFTIIARSAAKPEVSGTARVTVS